MRNYGFGAPEILKICLEYACDIFGMLLKKIPHLYPSVS